MNCEELPDFPNDHQYCRCALPISPNPLQYKLDFKAEEMKAVAEERYEDAAKFRDRIVPYVTYHMEKGFVCTYSEPGGYYL